MADVYLGLVHYPVYNKNMQVIASAITNFDIHDIARTCRTYDVKKYFLIHPLAVQQQIMDKILAFWQQGYGRIYNPDRSEALARVCYAASIADATAAVEAGSGSRPLIVTTDARVYPNSVSYAFVRGQLRTGKQPLLLLLGTAFGIEAEAMQSFDYILEPVYGCGTYNHLCVRSAAAIILDRLLGEAWWA